MSAPDRLGTVVVPTAQALGRLHTQVHREVPAIGTRVGMHDTLDRWGQMAEEAGADPDTIKFFVGAGHEGVDRPTPRGGAVDAAKALGTLPVLAAGVPVIEAVPNGVRRDWIALPREGGHCSAIIEELALRGDKNGYGNEAGALSIIAMRGMREGSPGVLKATLGMLAAVSLNQPDGVDFASRRQRIAMFWLDEVRDEFGLLEEKDGVVPIISPHDERPVYMEAWERIREIIGSTGNERHAREEVARYRATILGLAFKLTPKGTAQYSTEVVAGKSVFGWELRTQTDEPDTSIDALVDKTGPVNMALARQVLAREGSAPIAVRSAEPAAALPSGRVSRRDWGVETDGSPDLDAELEAMERGEVGEPDDASQGADPVRPSISAAEHAITGGGEVRMAQDGGHEPSLSGDRVDKVMEEKFSAQEDPIDRFRGPKWMPWNLPEIYRQRRARSKG